MTTEKNWKLLFQSVFYCFVSGQERYSGLVCSMLEQMESLNKFYSDEEIFDQFSQLAKDNIGFNIVENYLKKINNHLKIFSMEENIHGNNLLQIFLKNKVEDDIFSLLLNYSENNLQIINHSNKSGDTPLHFAIKYSKKLSIVENLVQHGAKISSQNKEKNTPLHLSALILSYNRVLNPSILDEQKKIFSFLISKSSADEIRIKNSNGNTILHQIILDKECSLGKTIPLTSYSEAIQSLVEKLSKYPALLGIKNDLNMTAFEIAFLNQNYAAIRALYSIGDHFFDSSLSRKEFANAILNYLKNITQEKQDCFKIFLISGGDKILKNTQLGHKMLKYVLTNNFEFDIIDILINDGGAKILDNGDAPEIWKSVFFQLSHNNNSQDKIKSVKVLLHIGLQIDKQDSFKRSALELAKLYHLTEEFRAAKEEFDTYKQTKSPNLKIAHHEAVQW